MSASEEADRTSEDEDDESKARWHGPRGCPTCALQAAEAKLQASRQRRLEIMARFEKKRAAPSAPEVQPSSPKQRACIPPAGKASLLLRA